MAAADVVICGGGVMGCALAYQLARRGVDTLLLERSGGKLAKSRRSAPLEPARAGETLLGVLGLLGLSPPGELRGQRAEAILEWAVTRWQHRPSRLSRNVVLE